MKDIIFDDFQNCVNDSLIRHKSILDILTKYSESASKVNRSIAKAVTQCGCISISAKKQHIPAIQSDSEIDLNKYLNSHLEGELCDRCREILEREKKTYEHKVPKEQTIINFEYNGINI